MRSLIDSHALTHSPAQAQRVPPLVISISSFLSGGEQGIPDKAGMDAGRWSHQQGHEDRRPLQVQSRTQEVLPTAGQGVALAGTLRAVLRLCAKPPLTFRLRGHDADSDPIKEIPS